MSLSQQLLKHKIVVVERELDSTERTSVNIIRTIPKMVDGQDDNNKLVVKEPGTTASDAEPAQVSAPAQAAAAGVSGTVGSLAKLVGDEAHRKKEALELSMGFVQ